MASNKRTLRKQKHNPKHKTKPVKHIKGDSQHRRLIAQVQKGCIQQRSSGSSVPTQIAAFFARYPTFKYSPSASAVKEFDRMCKQFHWKRDKDTPSPERHAAYELLRDAMAKQFNEIYGDADSLNAWQDLCRVLDISPIPENLKECRETVTNTHVNLVDLIERKSQHVTKFSSEKELSEYTREEKKFFPEGECSCRGAAEVFASSHPQPIELKQRGCKQQRRSWWSAESSRLR